MNHDRCRILVVISLMLFCMTCCIPVNAEDPYVITTLPFEINETVVSDLGTHQFLLGTDWTGTAGDPGAILVTAHDVILDGDSHVLTGTLDSDPDTGQTGIGVNADNVTVRNVEVSGWDGGIFYYQSNDGVISDTLTNQNVNGGIGMFECSQIALNNNRAEDSVAGDGINIVNSTRIWLENNDAIGNAHNGIAFNNVFQGGIMGGDVADNNDNGIGIWQDSRNISVGGNTVSGTVNGTGINVDGGEYIDLFDNQVAGIAQGPGIIYGHASNGNIVNNTVTGSRDAGIGLFGCSQIGINDNHATGSIEGDGIWATDSTRIWVGNNEATGNAHHGIAFNNVFQGSIMGGDFSDNNDNGIGIWQNSRNITILGNTIEGTVTGTGINAGDGEYIDILDNQVSGISQGPGIICGNITGGNIVNNTVTGARDAGIGLIGCTQIGINDNHATGSGEGDGIWVTDSTRIWVGNNEATGNAHHGIAFNNVFQGSIMGGDFSDNNDSGIGIWQNSRNITILGNTIEGTVTGTGINVDTGEYIDLLDNRVSGIAQGPGIIIGNVNSGNIINNTVTGARDVAIGLIGCDWFEVNDNHADGSGGGDGIAVVDSSRIWLNNNEATGNAHNGVSFNNVIEGVIFVGDFSDNNDNGIILSQNSRNISIGGNTVDGTVDGVGINVGGGEYIDIFDNRVSGIAQGPGIIIGNVNSGNIINNTVTGARNAGIGLIGCDRFGVNDNHASGSGEGNGITVSDSTRIWLNNNEAAGNALIGFALSNVSETAVVACNATANADTGIGLWDGSRNVEVSASYISGNGIGIGIGDLVQNNLVYNNYFNNTVNVAVSENASQNSWNIEKTAGENIIGGDFLGGNYWALPDGNGFSEITSDSDGDGICDTAYGIADANSDFLPLAIKGSPPVGDAPIADFTGAPTEGPAPLTVAFNDTSANNPTGWAWFFGDEDYLAPWTQVNASAGWSIREDHSSVVMKDGSIVLMGGNREGIIGQNDVWRSTDNGVTWTLVNASAGWSPRGGHTSLAMPDGSIVLMGGGTNDVWRSSDSGSTWTLVNASAGWSPRSGHTSVVMPDSSIVLMGGQPQNSHGTNDVWRSTDNGATWTQITANAEWSPRTYHTSVAMPDGSIVLMGGGWLPGSNDVWRSTDNGATWNLVNESAEWSPRTGHTSVAMPDGSIVLTGGRNFNDFKKDTWRSTDNGETWTLINVGMGRWLQTGVVETDGSIVMMGGIDYGIGRRNDVCRFIPAGSLAQNPQHTYYSPGFYPVTLQVYNTLGYNNTGKPRYINVTGTRLISINPASAGNIPDITIQIKGIGFEQGCLVDIRRNNTVIATAQQVSCQSYEILSAKFDLSRVTAGSYDLTVRWPEGTIRTIPINVYYWQNLVVKVWGPQRISPGQVIDYFIEYRNNDDQIIRNVSIEQNLPLTAKFLSCTGNGDYEKALHGVIWSVSDIPPKTGGYVTSKCVIDWGLSQGTQLETSCIIVGDRLVPPVDPSVNVSFENVAGNENAITYDVVISNNVETVRAHILSSASPVSEEYFPIFNYVDDGGNIYVIGDLPVKGSIDSQRNVYSTISGLFTKAQSLAFLANSMRGYTRDKNNRQEFLNWLNTQNKITGDGYQRLTKLNEGVTSIRGFTSLFYTSSGQLAGKYPVLKQTSIMKLIGDKVNQFIDKSIPGLNMYIGAEIYRKLYGSLPDGWDQSLLYSDEFIRLYKEAWWEYNTPEIWTPEHAGGRGISSANSTITVASDPNMKYGPEGHVSPGQYLDYRVEFENEGNGTAYGVYFTDVISSYLDASTLTITPVYSTVTHEQIAPQGIYSAENRTVIWTVGEVASKAGGYANISINVRADAPDDTEIINYATVYFPSVPEETRTNCIVSVVGINHQPDVSNVEYPAIGQKVAAPSTSLQWSGNDPDQDILRYDLYFGNSSAPTLCQQDIFSRVYPVESLAPSTTYYWKIVAKDPDGLTSTSPVWNFTTVSQPTITSIKPSKHAHGGKAFSMVITGTDFQPGVASTKVTIWRTSQSKNITATKVNATSQIKITSFFKIPKSTKPGKYNLTVTNPDGQSATLVNKFKVTT